MSLGSTLGIDPSNVMDDVIRQNAPDLVPASGPIDPSAMMDELIRRRVYGPKQPQPGAPPSDLSKFGRDPSAPADLAKFGRDPAPAEPAEPPADDVAAQRAARAKARADAQTALNASSLPALNDVQKQPPQAQAPIGDPGGGFGAPTDITQPPAPQPVPGPQTGQITQLTPDQSKAFDQNVLNQPKGFVRTGAQAFERADTQAFADIASLFSDWNKQTADRRGPDYVDKLLQQPMLSTKDRDGKQIQGGWSDPNWWSARMGSMIGGMAPAIAATTIGIPAPAAFGITSAMQSLVPAYKRMLDAGMSEDEAFGRAWAVAGVDGAVGTALGFIPGGAGEGATIKDAIKRSLINMGLVAPGTMVAGEKAKAAIEERPYGLKEAAETGLMGAAQGLALSAPHLLGAAMRGGDQRQPGQPDVQPAPGVPPTGPLSDDDLMAGMAAAQGRGPQPRPQPGAPGAPPNPPGVDAGADAVRRATAAGQAARDAAGSFRFDPTASDDDVLRQTYGAGADSHIGGMSAADKKTLADAIRREYARQGQQGGQPGTGPEPGSDGGAPPQPDPTDPNSQTHEERVASYRRAQQEKQEQQEQPPSTEPDPSKLTDDEIWADAMRSGKFTAEQVANLSPERKATLADQMRQNRVRAQARNAAERARAQSGAAERQATTTPEQRRRATQEGQAAYYGEHGADEVKSWSNEKLKDYVDQKVNPKVNDDEILRRAGVTPDEAAKMSPEEKKATAEEARGYGVHVGEEPPAEGSREAPINATSAEDVARAAAQADQEHTPAQGEANNRELGHMKWQGLDISIEAPAGGVRRGLDPQGQPWETSHSVPCGYIRGTEGADGMHVDVFMGPNPESPVVYVLDEKDEKTGQFRQHKAFIGFHSPLEAIHAYLGTSTKRPEHIGGMRMMPVDEFKTWLKEGDTKAPVSEAMGEPSKNAPRNSVNADTEIPPELHRAAIEGALRNEGIDPAQVDQKDIDRAAQIHAEEGAPAEDAFPVAVLRNLVDDGHISREDVAKELGNAQAAALLEPGARAGGQPPAQASGPAAGGTAATAAAEQRPQRAEDGAKPPGGRGGRAETAETAETSEPVRPAEAAKPDAGVTATSAAAGRAAAGHPAGGERTAANHEKPAGAKPESGVHAAEHEPAPDAAKAAVGEAELKPAKKASEIASKAAVNATPKAQSLLQFLAARGGLRSDDPLIPDLQSILGRNNHFVPGHGALIRQPKQLSTADRMGGKRAPMSLDAAREAAVEAGYIHDIGALTAAPATSTVRTLLDHIDDEVRGNRKYPAGREPESGQSEAQAASQEARNADLAKASARLGTALKKIKYPVEQFRPEDMRRATELMVDHGLDPLDAIERAVIEAEQDSGVVERHESDYIDLEDLGHAPERGAAHATGEAPARQGAGRGAGGAAEAPEVGGTAPGAGAGAGGRSEPVAAGEHEPGFAEPDRDLFSSEPGAEGKPQSVIPGTERISSAELAKRRAAEPLKAKVAQKPLEGGLFGERAKQLDLLDMARARPESAKPPENIQKLSSEKPKAPFPGPFDSGDKALLAGLPEGATFIEGKGPLGSGKFGVEVPGGNMVGNLYPSKAEAAKEARGILAQRAEWGKQKAERDAKLRSLANRLIGGAEASDADLRLLDLKPGAGLKWFIPAASELFGIPARAVRPYIADLIHVGHSDMGAKQESVPAKKALSAIAKDLAGDRSSLFPGLEPKEKPGSVGFAEGGNDYTAPPFYSAVARTIESAKQEKASPNHWLGMLKNAPGVKPEEMDWLGLPEWLRDHKGPVTKQAIADYIRANRIEVREVEKGGTVDVPREWEQVAADRWEADNGYLISKEQRDDGVLQFVVYDNDARPIGLRGATLDDAKEAAARDSGAAPRTKFGQYTLHGGSNYRELLLTRPERGERGPMPFEEWARLTGHDDTPEARHEYRYSSASGESNLGQGNFRSSHWDEPNVLAHVRFDDRVIDGKRTLHVAEFQSDWHQKGRREGYKDEAGDKQKMLDLERERDEAQRRWEHLSDEHHAGRADVQEVRAAYDAFQEADRRYGDIRIKRDQGVPDAPFKTTWPEFALKRMIRYAAENGYDKLSWDSGDTNAERYDLSKQISALYVDRLKDGTYNVSAKGHQGHDHSLGNKTEAQLADAVGKEMAEKIANNKGDNQSYSGLDLKVGGEGMRAFYDKILPAAASKLTKKFGTKVETGTIDAGRGKWRYDGPELTANQVTELRHGRPLTSAIDTQLRQIAAAIEGGSTTAKAVEDWGSIASAERLGGKTVETRTSAPVHTLDITDSLRHAAVNQGFALFEGDRNQPQLALGPGHRPIHPSTIPEETTGPFRPTGRAPIAKEAQDYVLSQGRATGNEHLIAIDHEGKVAGTREGISNFVGIDPNLMKSLDDPSKAIVVHHNHPSNTGLSNVDIGMLGSPGLAAVWAHGHGGNVARIALSPHAKAKFAKLGTPQQVRSAIFKIANAIQRSVYDTIQNAVLQNRVSMDGALRVMPEVVARALQRGGLVDYRTNADVDHIIDELGLEPHIERAARVAAGVLHVPGFPTIRDDRRAEPLRHPGDVGASFEADRGVAGQHGEQARPAGLGARVDRPQAPEQLRLLEGEGGFAEDGPKFTAAGGKPSRSTSIRTRIAGLLESRLANKIIEGTQDLSHPVKLLQQELEARRDGPLSDGSDFYTKKRLYPGLVGNEVREFNKEHLDPLVDLMKKNRISLQQAGDYLYAKHVWERNDFLGGQYPADHQFSRARTDDSIVGASGRSQEWADRILEQARRDGTSGVLERVAARVQRIREYALDKMVEGQLLSRATADTWRARYNHYVDLRGFEDAPEEAPSDYREPARFNVRGKEVKQAFGRTSKADNPIVNMVDQAYRSIDRAERNRYLGSVWNALADMTEEAHSADGPDISDIVKLDRGTPKKVLDKNTGFVKTVDDSSYANGPNTVSLKLGGRPHHMVFENRDMAEAVKRMSPDSLGMFQGLLNLENKLKALWTHYSPDFLFRHFIFRYPIEGTLNSFEQKESGPHSVAKYISDAFPFMGQASRAIFASNKDKALSSAAGKEMQDYWDEMRKAGGGMIFRQSRDMDLLREHLQTQLMSLRGKPVASLRERWRRGVEAMDAVTNTLDNSLRLAAYASARKQGKTPQQAALIAREATVDFQLKGKWANALGMIWPFASVAIQTGARMSKAVYRSKIMRRVFMSTMAMGFMTAMFNYLMGGDDKDGVPFFEKIPEWDRRLNFIVLNPFDRDDQGRPTPIKIPMPYNWAFPLTMGHAMGTMVFGKEGVRKALHMVARSGLEVLTPFGQEENMAAVLAPELLRPAIYVATNRDYADRPIHNDPTFQKGPNAEAGRRNTGDGWKYLASTVNKESGGTGAEKGWLDFYPEDYRQIFDYVAGSQSRLAQNVYNSGASLAQGEAPDPTHVPLERVIRGTNYDAADRAIFYEQRKQVNEAHDSAELYQRGRAGNPASFRTEHAAELGSYQAFHSADEQIRNINKQIDALKANQKILPDEREQQLNQLEQYQLNAMARARQALDKAKQRHVSP